MIDKEMLEKHLKIMMVGVNCSLVDKPNNVVSKTIEYILEAIESGDFDVKNSKLEDKPQDKPARAYGCNC